MGPSSRLLLLLALGCGPSAGEVAGPPTVKTSTQPAAPTSADAGEVAADDAVASTATDAPAKAKIVRPPVILPTPADAGTCPGGRGPSSLGIMTSPDTPAVGQALRITAATLDGEAPLALRIEDGTGQAIEATITHRPGVPAAVLAELTPASAGTLKVIVGRGGAGIGCVDVKVRKAPASTTPSPAGRGAWPVSRAWTSGEEALFSAFVRELFHAERDVDLAYRALDQVTRDPARNILHNARGWDEDSAGSPAALAMKPDCADTPYFFRAYFAWKRGLPFAFRKCSRGAPGKAPRCGPPIANVDADPGSGNQPGELGTVQYFLRRTLAWGVHTGNGRVAHGDSGSDLYPVRLDRRGLRPGTVYADPYGHILVVAELVDPEGERPGVLYAVDGQPDGSITRKRFWEGNFLWNQDPALGGSGFKGFRPLAKRTVDGREVWVQLTDEEIASDPAYGDFSLEQSELAGVAFYDRMEALITPGVRDPQLALEEAVIALHEAAKVRVTSIDNGERHFAGGGGVIAMPDGFHIFETTGAWENFSTPARDLRLLVAIDLVNGFADKVRRQPEVFGVAAGADQAKRVDAVVRALEERRAALVADERFRFSYTRMDGSVWTLGLGELLARAPALEIAYNPNQCPELRWGAAEGSEEAKTCKRRMTAEQRAKMERYRPWFRERRRPPRGAMEP